MKIIKLNFLIIFLSLTVANNAFADDQAGVVVDLSVLGAVKSINSFETDFCSVAPESLLKISKKNWGHCCIEHDIAYWAGGTSNQRLLADARLRQCMKKVDKLAAQIFYSVVRVMGHPEAMTNAPSIEHRTYQWGFGWNHYGGYDKLDNEQNDLVCSQLSDWQNTGAYSEFYQTYISIQKEEPILPVCH